jgi:glyoxylate reductase
VKRLRRVFVSRRLPGRALERLARGPGLDVEIWPRRQAPSPRALARACRDAEGLLCLLSDRVDAALLAAAPRLRAISSYSVGLDHVDLAAATARGIPVGHTPGVLTETTAELALALLLAAARRIPEADRCVREGRWAGSWDPSGLLGRDLQGATLGVIGLGPIGRAVAARARALGMRVLGWSRSGRRVPGVARASLDELLAGSDFVSIHVALAPETRRLLGAAELARMRPGAILVNTARGGIVDEEALARALHQGRLGGAALDVTEREPLPATSPLLAAPNLILTPHIGSASVATRARMAELAVENLLAGLAGRRMPCCANPELELRRGSGRGTRAERRPARRGGARVPRAGDRR